MDLKGKKIILTGASSGIGQALLPLLHEKGSKILAVGRKKFDSNLSSITYIQQDISTQEGVDYVFEQANEILGGVDIFIANAGFAYYEGAEKADWYKAQAIFNTNVNSPIYAFHKLAEIKGNEPFQYVVTASAISYVPLAGYALYSATKHAVQGFFEAARYELPKHQVVTLIHPVATKTAFFSKDTPVPFPAQTSETVAKHYIKGIERNKPHIFPLKIFWAILHLTALQPLIKKREAQQFNLWRKKHE